MINNQFKTPARCKSGTNITPINISTGLHLATPIDITKEILLRLKPLEE
jgi:hypothetical protein